jgi:hypothetical protein
MYGKGSIGGKGSLWFVSFRKASASFASVSPCLCGVVSLLF